MHCIRVTRDRLVYVCDRVNNRIQVFKTSGEFVTEKFLRDDTLLNGSVWDLDKSRPYHRYRYHYTVLSEILE